MNDSARPSRRPRVKSGDAGAADGGPSFAAVLAGFTLDSGQRTARRRRGSAGRVEPAVAGLPLLRQPKPRPPQPGATSPDDVHDEWPGPDPLVEDIAALVRPYQWTGGRTRAAVRLGLETLVSTSERGADEHALTCLEHRTVAGLCRHPHAVAEVAAKLSLPLGVARVLLSDMAEQGLITVHQTVADEDMAAHLVLMERVLSGLRRL